MTMKRILHCTLICMVLVTAGCDLFPSSDTNSPPQNINSQSTPQPRNTINFTGARNDVQEAFKRLNTSGRSDPSLTVKPAKDAINEAIKKLGKDRNDIARRCGDCEERTINGAAEGLQNLNEILAKLGTDKKTIVALGEVKADVQQGLSDEASRLEELSTAKPKTTEEPSPSPSPATANTNTNINNNKNNGWVWDTLIFSAKIIAVLLTLVLLVSAVNYMWKRAWKTVELNVSKVLKAHLAAAREAQPDYAAKISSLSSAQAEMSSNLTELNTEVRSLARIVRESLVTRRSDGNTSYGGFNYQSLGEVVVPKDEPEFPVSAVDYLDKMDRFANVVRPDFQNGILVNAPDGDGELVLIRDSRDDTQPLFVVPRATQFQTKQDFYTYYQKYYDCVRPSAGDVWIIGPAVVEKVAGGWQLREKGMLEIR